MTVSIFQSLQFKVEILRATFSCADFAHLKYRAQGCTGDKWSLHWYARLDSVEALDLLPPVPRAERAQS